MNKNHSHHVGFYKYLIFNTQESSLKYKLLLPGLSEPLQCSFKSHIKGKKIKANHISKNKGNDMDFVPTQFGEWIVDIKVIFIKVEQLQ